MCGERRLKEQPGHHLPVLMTFTFLGVTFLLQLLKQKQNNRRTHIHSAPPVIFYLFSINEKAGCVPKRLQPEYHFSLVAWG